MQTGSATMGEGCAGCGGTLNAGEGAYGEQGELLCRSCEGRAHARAADALMAAGLRDEGLAPASGLSGWQMFRLGLIGFKILVLIIVFASH